MSKNLNLADTEVILLLPVVTYEDIVTSGILTVAADINDKIVRVIISELASCLTVSNEDCCRGLLGLPYPAGVVISPTQFVQRPVVR